jgi:hypothetical protein
VVRSWQAIKSRKQYLTHMRQRCHTWDVFKALDMRVLEKETSMSGTHVKIPNRWAVAIVALLMVLVVALPASATTVSGTTTCLSGNNGFTRGTADNWQHHWWHGTGPYTFTYYGNLTKTRDWGYQLGGTYNWTIEGPNLTNATGFCVS